MCKFIKTDFICGHFSHFVNWETCTSLPDVIRNTQSTKAPAPKYKNCPLFTEETTKAAHRQPCRNAHCRGWVLYLDRVGWQCCRCLERFLASERETKIMGPDAHGDGTADCQACGHEVCRWCHEADQGVLTPADRRLRKMNMIVYYPDHWEEEDQGHKGR